MTDVLDEVLRHLEALVSFDTRNPPRAMGTGGIFDYTLTFWRMFQPNLTGPPSLVPSAFCGW